MIIFKPHEIVPVLKQFLPSKPVIIEGGAFNGNDTKKMAALWPEGAIHAFEPVPDIYKQLVNNTHTFKNVHTYNYALSDSDTSALFYVSEKPTKPGRPSQAGSLHKPKERLDCSSIIFPRTIEVPTITVHTWAHRYGIADQIDLLWLDTQGHELPILKSMFQSRFAQKCRVIFTEVAFIQAYEGQAMYHEVVDWIIAQGFEYVGRDFEDQTDSFFGNVLMIRK